ncbi:helix-turn-helix domain-containing protein [Phascolarctobacterium succinatutens]|jgi:transcriptional regulator with XRE-family HTH domain|uniref:helix-turn-helix domain-containing protein n=1 Tax=Phascolarctobacterium succinatutens TaxID=626940 RepID=UPI00206BE049|nr:MAG TPA: helix-turn-helix domain protein [Caudoviricetes sp.]
MSEKELTDLIERIKERRLKLEMSYQDLSDATGISKSTLQRYETGYIKKVPINQIEILAKALHTTPSYLMGWDNTVTEAPSVPLTPRDERQIAADLEKMLADLDSKNAMAAMGGTVEDDEDRELLKASLQATMRLAKKIAKEKYTPKKYRHEEE